VSPVHELPIEAVDKEQFLFDTNIISEIVKLGRDSVVLGMLTQTGTALGGLTPRAFADQFYIP
jgi:hypothetical protein